jgi:aminoglycoside phosphotransferase family enzyme
MTRGVEPSTAGKLIFLADPHNLGDAGPIEFVETHFAWVFLGRRFAYKLRKPVRYHGLDTRTLASRRAMCQAELRLNAALAPGIYLEVVPMTHSAAGQLRLGGSGKPVDWLIKMRRLPRARMLDTLIRTGPIPAHELTALARKLCRFYRSAVRGLSDGTEYRRRLRARITTQRNDLLAGCHSQRLRARVRRVARLQEATADSLREQLAERAEGGHIRECHGDLRPEHICLGPPLCVIDRLEFDRELRMLDPLEELSFLALECARLGAPEVGESIRAICARQIAAHASPSLLGLYTSLQATTRAVLRVWRMAEGSRADQGRWQRQIDDYLQRALTAIREARSATHDLRDSARRRPRSSRQAAPPASRPRQLLPADESAHNPSRRSRRRDGPQAALPSRR